MTEQTENLAPDFASLNLEPSLEAALFDLGYFEPTPIQARAIPMVLKGKDLIGLAQTGTGKTAAFALPVLNHLCLNDAEPPKKGTRVLILAPTRELVTQISDQVRSYGRKMPHLSVANIYGGVSILRHIKRLAGGVDVIVATPGRLLDLLERKSVQLSDVEMLVLDEADQMMDMGFIHALKKIVPLLPKERQTLLFSATMAPKIRNLADRFLTDPEQVTVTPPNTTAELVEQRITFVNKNEKFGLLALHVLEPEVTRAIVFTRTKHGADRVVKNLRKIGIESRAIHGNKSQAQRQRSLEAFRNDEFHVLIATDVAARGIDIPEVSHVFNYEIPNVPEQYVHRIGRTARAKRSGIAHAFVAADEKDYLKDIQKLLKTEIPKVDLPEDFLNKVRALNSREALPPPPKPAQEPRKGRGKSRKKKNAGEAKAKSGKRFNDKADKTKNAPKKTKPSRAERKRTRAQEGGENTRRRENGPKTGKPFKKRGPAKDHNRSEKRDGATDNASQGRPHKGKPFKKKRPNQNKGQSQNKDGAGKPRPANRSGKPGFKRKPRRD